MYGRHAVGDADRFQPSGHEDYAFWLDLLHQGGPAVGGGGSEPVACYLVRDGSISRNKARAVKWQWHIYRRHQGLGLLATAKTLARRLEQTGRYKVVLSRDRDVFVRLRDRIAIARRAGADLFMSLHADSIDDKSLRGLSVYTLSETASDAEAAQLAARENKVDIIAGIDLSDQAPEVTDILIDLAQRRTDRKSTRLNSSH